VLSRRDIIEAIERGDVTFDPEIEIQTSVEQVPVDLRLGRKFTRFRELAPHVPALYVEASVFEHSELWDVVEGDTCRLEPGELVLAQTLEFITLPNYLMGLVEGRSSWGRMGITTHVTAPKIDPGFEGNIVLEMVNLSKTPYELRAGHDKPAQLMLIPVSTPLESEETYGPTDRFFGQRGAIQESKS
jgi:dCTP deaminase